jgi:hypothetical protein
MCDAAHICTRVVKACDPVENPCPREDLPRRGRSVIWQSLSLAKLNFSGVKMKKLALGLATVATFAVMSIGVASPAMADCSVHVNNGGTDVSVNWC